MSDPLAPVFLVDGEPLDARLCDGDALAAFIVTSARLNAESAVIFEAAQREGRPLTDEEMIRTAAISAEWDAHHTALGRSALDLPLATSTH